MQWQFRTTEVPQSVSEVEQLLLKQRNLTDPELYFNPPHPSTFSPSDVGINEELLQTTVERLRKAGTHHEKVLIFGDYDADGICATTVLWQSLHHLGCDVKPFIPDRLKHGYGITRAALDTALAEFKPDLIVTVDNGIVAFPVLTELAKIGQTVIITDHHQPERDASGVELFPPAFSIVHTPQLCGTTVAWMLSSALTPDLANEQLDLCAIATTADLVPLADANRSFAYHGLKQLRKTNNLGLQELLKAARITPQSCTTQTIGYILGPRINAMGRLAQGMDALRLLCTKQQRNAEKLARLLDVTNGERQDLTDDLFQEAIAQAEIMQNERILIVHSASFHEGVVGLIAGKLVEKYHKPAVAISVRESIAKASARSVDGVNIVELLRLVRDDLLEVGGHPMAAGFGVLPSKLELVTKRLQKTAQELVTAQQLERRLEIACELPFSLLTEELVACLSKFEPFGKGNQSPLFAIKNVCLDEVQTVGKEQKHLKLLFNNADASDIFSSQGAIQGLYWRNGHRLQELQTGSVVALAGVAELNVWKNRKNVQFVVRDIKVNT